MPFTQQQYFQAAQWLTGGAVVLGFVSIAVSQSLLGLAIVALLASRTRWQWPPIVLPLSLFLGGTVLSLFVNGHLREGLPQIKKFYVFLILAVVYTVFQTARQALAVLLSCAVAACASALWSVAQFGRVAMEAQRQHIDLYRYIGDRTKGFMSHWMTFGGEEMMILLLMLALGWLAAHPHRWRRLVLVGAGLIGMALVLNQTRSVWLGTLVGLAYLLYRWRPQAVVVLPALLAVGFLVAPGFLRSRVQSILQPHGQADSNSHRVYCWRTGWEMIKAHPWFGLGPEEVGPQFDRYIPRDLAKPRPVGYYGHLHNDYIQYAAERGVPVLLMMLWLLWRVARDLVSALIPLRDAEGDERAIIDGTLAAMVALLVAGLFEYNLGDSEVLLGFLSFVALAYVAVRSLKQAREVYAG